MILSSQLNYWLGVALVIICAALLCAFGAKLVSMASTYMMYLVIAVLALIIILSMSSGKLDLGAAIANQASTPGIEPSLPKALWSGVIYAAFQATVIANISSVANQLPNRSTSKKAAVIGICGNALMLVALSLFLLSATSLADYNVLDTKAKLVYIREGTIITAIVTGKVMAFVKKSLSPLVQRVCFGGAAVEAEI